MPATYFGVGTDWIYLKSKGVDGSPGKILFDTDALIINTPNLKFNHTGSAYSQGAFMINTDSFSVNQTEGTICGLQMGKKNILYTSQTSEEKLTGASVTISGTWSQVGSIDMGGKYPTTIYSTHKILSYSELGVPTNAIVTRVSLVGVNGPSSGNYPQAWASSFNSNSIAITALNTYSGGTISCTCKVHYVTISQAEEEKPVSYLNSIDNSFYIRTSTDDSTYSESFIQDLNLVSVQSNQLITNTANIGTLSFNGACITCQGMDIDFGYEIGDNNTRLEVNISHIGNLIILTAQSAMGEFAGYPIQFLVRYKLDGNDDYFYTALELPALGTYVSKMIDSVFSITEVAFQSFDNPNNYMTEADIDIRDDYNGYDRGIGIRGGMLVPAGGKYTSAYGTWVGGGLGSYRDVWGWVCTNSLSLRNVGMPTIEYGSFTTASNEGEGWYTKTITLSGVYSQYTPPMVMATIEPSNNAASATLYVRTSASVTGNTATITISYRRNNDGTATIKWIALAKYGA